MLVNSGWLKQTAWELFDHQIMLEHINSEATKEHDIVVYVYLHNNIKTGKILKWL